MLNIHIDRRLGRKYVAYMGGGGSNVSSLIIILQVSVPSGHVFLSPTHACLALALAIRPKKTQGPFYHSSHASSQFIFMNPCTLIKFGPNQKLETNSMHA